MSAGRALRPASKEPSVAVVRATDTELDALFTWHRRPATLGDEGVCWHRRHSRPAGSRKPDLGLSKAPRRTGTEHHAYTSFPVSDEDHLGTAVPCCSLRYSAAQM
jgi:hypothetical protein